MLVAALALLLYSYSPKGKDCGSDFACFMEYANECRPASLTIDFAGNILEYHSTDDCRLIKKITRVTPSESIEVKDFLEGKEMICDYDRYYLNQTWVENFATGLEACDGELKDAIVDLRLAMTDLTWDEMAENMTSWYDLS